MRIILIDDELNIRRTVVPVLKSMNHDVVAAATAAAPCRNWRRRDLRCRRYCSILRLGRRGRLGTDGESCSRPKPRLGACHRDDRRSPRSKRPSKPCGRARSIISRSLTRADQLQQGHREGRRRTRQLENKVAELESRVLRGSRRSPILDHRSSR